MFQLLSKPMLLLYNSCYLFIERFGVLSPLRNIPSSFSINYVNNVIFLSLLKFGGRPSRCLEHYSRRFINAYSVKHWSEALALGRNGVRMLTRAVTGYCGLNKHMSNIKLRVSKECMHLHTQLDTKLFHWAGTILN